MRLSSALLTIPGHHAPTLCYPGSLIGRVAAARLRVHHPEISEAHALLSARDGGMWLLALRRPLLVDGRPEWQVPLTQGRSIALAEGVALVVERVWLTTERLALVIDGGRPLPLGDGQALVRNAGGLQLVDGAPPGALALVWSSEGELWLGVDPPLCLEPGLSLSLAGHALQIVVTTNTGTAWTGVHVRRPRTTVQVSPRIATDQDEHGARGELIGNAAVLLWAMATWVEERGDDAVPWQAVATALWGAKQAPLMRDNLRNNVMYRFDQRLRGLGLRDDLVCRDEGLLWFGEGVEVHRMGEPVGEAKGR
jgi:hypothetical protein